MGTPETPKFRGKKMRTKATLLVLTLLIASLSAITPVTLISSLLPHVYAVTPASCFLNSTVYGSTNVTGLTAPGNPYHIPINNHGGVVITIAVCMNNNEPEGVQNSTQFKVSSNNGRPNVNVTALETTSLTNQGYYPTVTFTDTDNIVTPAGQAFAKNGQTFNVTTFFNQQYNFIVDNTKPTITAVTATTAGACLVSCTEASGTTSDTFTATATDGGSGVASIKITASNGTFKTYAFSPAGSPKTTAPATKILLSPGNNFLTIDATDAAGNAATQVTAQIYVIRGPDFTSFALILGWNLISSPVILNGTDYGLATPPGAFQPPTAIPLNALNDVHSFFRDIPCATILAVWQYTGGIWKFWKCGVAPGATVIATIQDGQAYFILTSAAITLYAYGYTTNPVPLPPRPVYTLGLGWNGVGFTETSAEVVAGACAVPAYMCTFSGAWVTSPSVWILDGAGAWSLTSAAIPPGKAFFIYVTTAGTFQANP